MSIAESENSKPAFTPEQRQALARVYSFLIDLGQKRKSRMGAQSAEGKPAENKIADNSGMIEEIPGEQELSD